MSQQHTDPCYIERVSSLIGYYATFKVRKLKSLFYKINTCLQINNHLHWIAGRASILSKYIAYIFFNFGRGFCGSFSMLLTKAPASCGKKLWSNFSCIVLLFAWAQNMCLRYLKSYFKLEILIFLSFMVSIFTRSVQLKGFFSDE